MKKAFVFSWMVVATAHVFPQPIKLDKHFSNWKPRCIGPAGMSGRITAIDALVDNPNIIYLGAASGGIWKTENGGAKWIPVFDEQPIQNIGSLAIQQTNPSIVWAGTGEGNPRNSINLGEGIYKSLDAGKTWKRMGLEKTRNIHRILIDPNQPEVVYAGAIGNPYADHPERGVFKTIDGGTTWEKILYTNDTSGVGDMVIDPSNPNKLFVAMWQHRRTPWSLQSGGKGSGLYMTLDGGKNWKKLGKPDGLPEGNYGRIGLAISRSNPKRVYALIESAKNGLYKTDDGGYHWELVSSDPQWVSNRPFYFQEIAVDPQNENRVWLIYQMISVSEDAGKTFNIVIPYNGIHPDHHAFWIHPRDGNFIIDGNDGGIGISRDRGKTWQFDEKLPVGQFYHVNVDNELPYNVMGGMQDNGTWRGPAYTWMGGGIKNYYWESVWGGDGFDVMPDPDDANWVYAMSQGGSVGRYNVKTGERWFIRPAAPDLKTRLRFNWNAAIAQDPFDRSTIYFASQHLHRSLNKGISWETISGDLTTNDSIKIDQTNNGGISVDITGAENYCTILTIAPSSVEKGVIWVGTDDGNVQLTRDGGKSWTNFRNKIPGLPAGSWIPQINASRFTGGEVFVVANDYRRGDFKPYIFRTTDYGKTWTRMVDEKKVTGYTLCVLQDPVERNLVFVGTEQGLWVSFDNGGSFQQWKNGYPAVSTYDLAIQEREADLVIATFGRALYILDDIRPL
ncbi:MAG: WD40/YVTN/BNR-like repeat-containing protein, partial [Flavitalea sp.]